MTRHSRYMSITNSFRNIFFYEIFFNILKLCNFIDYEIVDNYLKFNFCIKNVEGYKEPRT